MDDECNRWWWIIIDYVIIIWWYHRTSWTMSRWSIISSSISFYKDAHELMSSWAYGLWAYGLSCLWLMAYAAYLAYLLIYSFWWSWSWWTMTFIIDFWLILITMDTISWSHNDWWTIIQMTMTMARCYSSRSFSTFTPFELLFLFLYNFLYSTVQHGMASWYSS